MDKDNKRLLIYLSMQFLSILLLYKIPHDSYSIAQYIVKPIKTSENSVLYFYGLIPLILMIIGITGFLNLKRFENKSKFLLFLLVVVIIMPIMKGALDITRTAYSIVNENKLNAVDIKDPMIRLMTVQDKMTVTVSFDLIDYGKKTNTFKFRVFLPKSLANYTGLNTIESNSIYTTHGNRNGFQVEESFDINPDNISTEYTDPRWFYEEVIYELYNEQEAVRIIDHGYW